MDEERIYRIEDLIQHQIDFETRLDSIHQEAKRKLRSLENEHQTNLYSLISNINLNQDRITQLKNLRENYQETTDELFNILLEERDSIADYKKIESMAIIHRNFKKVRDLSEKIMSLEDDITKYENLDCIKDLKEKHMLAFNFEEFRYELFYYISGVDRDLYLSVTRKINTLDRAILNFLGDFLRIGDNFLEIFNDENICKEVQIILGFEENRDKITRKVNDVSEGGLITEELKRINYRYQNRAVKELKEKFENSMKGGIKRRLKELWEKGIENFDCVFDDFDTISKFMKYNVEGTIEMDKNSGNDSDKNSGNDSDKNDDNESDKNDENLEIYIDWKSVLISYNDSIKEILEDCDLSSRHILYILGFVDFFYSDLHSKFEIPKEEFSQTILGDCEDKYIKEYIRTASATFISWIDTIKTKEIENFIERDTPPILDEENKYVSDNFITLLSLIKEQLDPIAFNDKIFDSVAGEILKFSKSFTVDLIKVMEKELTNSLRKNSKPGFEEYTIMVGNSGLKITQYVTSLPQAQNNELKELGELFLDITKRSNTILTSYIISTCKSAFDKIFTDDWYNEDTTRVLLLTLEDFLTDYVGIMSGFSFFLFMNDLTNEIINCYFKQLIRNRAKIYEDCGYRVEKDCERLHDTFAKFTTDVDFSHLLKISPLLGKCSIDIFEVELKSLLMARPDIKRDVIKTIIKKKDELTDSEKKSYLSSAKACFAEFQNERSTIYGSKMK